jgi:hypothetical protein
VTSVSGPVLFQLKRDLQNISTNEQLTRRRVELLEAFVAMSFWGRIRWLFTGR